MRPVSDTDVFSQFHKITFSSVPGQLWNTNASLSVQLICLCSPNTSYLFFFRQKILVTCSQWITNYPASGWEVQRKIFSDCTSLVSFFSGIFNGIMDKIGGESELLVFSLSLRKCILFVCCNKWLSCLLGHSSSELARHWLCKIVPIGRVWFGHHLIKQSQKYLIIER